MYWHLATLPRVQWEEWVQEFSEVVPTYGQQIPCSLRHRCCEAEPNASSGFHENTPRGYIRLLPAAAANGNLFPGSGDLAITHYPTVGPAKWPGSAGRSDIPRRGVCEQAGCYILASSL
jgi:hypothetical protein